MPPDDDPGPPEATPAQPGLDRDPDQAVEGLAERYAAVVGPHLPAGAPFALLDFPDHSNVGDSAIYAGEMAFLDAHVRRPPSYVCSLRTYRQDVDRFAPEGTVLLHGGGNFGDTWPRYEAFRADVLSRYRHRKVVQLAQSIHYGDPSKAEAMARVIGAHPDFTLLVRDEPSLEFARARFPCPVELCPDAAYALRRLTPRRAPDAGVFVLLRKDRESREDAGVAAARALGPVGDWKERDLFRRGPVDVLMDRVIAPRAPESAFLMRRRERMFRRFAANLVAQGVELLGRGEVIVTDRLHGHILSSLMRRRHVALDNTYGKISRYVAAWGDDGLALLARTPDELRAALLRLGAAPATPDGA